MAADALPPDGLDAQEPREVPRDAGIGGVRQADLLQADAPLRAGIASLTTAGKKPSSRI